MRTDTEITQEAQTAKIEDIVRAESIDGKYLGQYGKDRAKASCQLLENTEGKPDGELMLVTAITSTSASEDKTTASVSLADGLKRLGKGVAVASRGPSLGPVLGVEGGAVDGGYAQVVSMEEIGLHFTGDSYAIDAASNLLAALVDNRIFQGNALRIDDKRIAWKRTVDMNDRQLRNIIDGLSRRTDGRVCEDSSEITVASEIMAVFCLTKDLENPEERLTRVIVDYNMDDEPVTAGGLHAKGALTAFLKDAPRPNLMQTLERASAFIHGGPFADIAHGCNSVLATRLVLRLNDYAVTETSFGADPGAEKFIDIRCRVTGLHPDCAVAATTVCTSKYHGGIDKAEFNMPNVETSKKGFPNLLQRVENVTKAFGLPTVVAINRFPFDSEGGPNCIMDGCKKLDVNVMLSEAWTKGGEGGEALTREVMRLCEGKADNHFRFAYEDSGSLEEKLNKIVHGVYRGGGVVFTAGAKKQAKYLEELSFGHYPVCMAKTWFSFSGDRNLAGAPRGFKITVREVKVPTGTGFIVVKIGDIMTTPDFPKVPAAEHIGVDENGKITGLP